MNFLKLNLAVLALFGKNTESLNQTPAVAIFPNVINMQDPFFSFDANQPHFGLEFTTTHTQVNQTIYDDFAKQAALENAAPSMFSLSHLIAMVKLGSTIVSSVQTAYQFGLKAMGLARKIFNRKNEAAEDASVKQSMPEISSTDGATRDEVATKADNTRVATKAIKKTRGFTPLRGNPLKLSEAARKTSKQAAKGRVEGQLEKIESIYRAALNIKR